SSAASDVYKRQPLTETDLSAFDAFVLDEEAYRFIEGGIDIREEHPGLFDWFEEDIRRKKKSL
ncbi:MAG: hypothetical protein N2Z79_03530, partial [Candidatus Omnitrophica bacterium]|nr:hypothetical protein [Candidatus Omnitrophota bacterium]